MKVIKSKNRGGFFEFLNSRLKRRPKIGALTLDNGSSALTDVQKAEAFAEFFGKVFIPNTTEPASKCTSRFPEMVDFPWFSADNIYEVIQSWPCSFSLTPDHTFSFH